MFGSFLVAEQLADSQVGLSSMELVIPWRFFHFLIHYRFYILIDVVGI
jgi:hypothetical protein